MAESRSWSACAGPRRGSGLWRLLCTPSSWDGQNGSLTGRDSRGVSLPQQPPILHASSDSVVEASPTSSLIEFSGSGAGAVDDMCWMQARCAGRRPSRLRCAGRRSSRAPLANIKRGRGVKTNDGTAQACAHGAWYMVQGVNNDGRSNNEKGCGQDMAWYRSSSGQRKREGLDREPPQKHDA